MKFRRVGVLSLLAGLTFSVLNCSSKNNPSSPAAPTPTPTPAPNVTVLANYGASSAPWNLHFDKAGNLYVALTNTSGPCTVVKIASPGGASPVTSLAYTGTAAIGLSAAVADSSGNLWLAGEAANVIEIPAGGGTPITISTGFVSTSQTIDLVINSAGTTLYMGDGIDSYIYRAHSFQSIGGSRDACHESR